MGHEIVEEESAALELIEKDYRENEWPKVVASIVEMRKEVPVKERNQMRLAYLQYEYKRVMKELLAESGEFVASKKELPHWHLKKIDELTKRGRSLSANIRALTEPREGQGLLQADIIRANSFPIESLIKTVRGMANCPFHDDRSPSLNVRKNFYYCHGCGEHGDVISFVMKTEQLTFPQAVNRLLLSTSAPSY